MLNKKTADLSVNLSEVISNQGLRLIPKLSTLMHQLFVSTPASINQNANSDEWYHDTNTIVGSLIEGTKGTEDREKTIRYLPSEHDTYMDNYIDELSMIVSKHIQFARATVNKEITHLKDTLEEQMNSFNHRTPEDFFNITYYKVDPFHKSAFLSDELRNYSGSLNKEENVFINLDDLDPTKLIDFMLTGDELVDQELSNWFNGIEEAPMIYLGENIDLLTLDIQTGLNYALVNYIFYRNLAINKNLNTGDSSVVLGRKALTNRDYFGNLFVSFMTRYDRSIQQGTLVTENSDFSFSMFSDTKLDITVYEENFVKLAEAGLGIETLLGYIASSDSNKTITVDGLIAQGDKNNVNWERTRSLYLITLNNKRLDTFKMILKQVFESSIAEGKCTEAELEFMDKDPMWKDKTRELVTTYIDSLNNDCLKDIEQICLDVVAKYRFRFSNSYTILSNMKIYMEADEKLDPMQAALYSIIDYLVDYNLDQFSITRD